MFRLRDPQTCTRSLCCFMLFPLSVSPPCQDEAVTGLSVALLQESHHLISCIMVIVLYSVNFISVCEAVDNSCWLSSSPSYLSSSRLSGSFLAGQAHLLIEKWRIRSSMTGNALSQFPASRSCRPHPQQAMKESWRWCLNDEVSERMLWLPRLESDGRDSGSGPQKPNPSVLRKFIQHVY